MTKTQNFCLYEIGIRKPDECLALIKAAEVIGEALGTSIQFMNTVDLNPESEFYNPDGMIGHFVINDKPE